VLGVLPAHECLDADDGARLDRHLGLEEDAELLVLDRAPDRALGVQAGRRGIALSVCRRVRARWRVTSSNSISRPPPASLARYIAASASRIRLPTSWSGAADSVKTKPRRA